MPGTDLTFGDGDSLRTTLPKLRITNVIRPAMPAYTRNKVVLPGKDGSYDFGENKKEDFLITVEVVISADSASALQASVHALGTYLDGKETLVFTDDSETEYQAQVYDGVYLTGDASARFVKGVVVFECDAG